MSSPQVATKLLLILVLAIAPLTAAYSQQSGTYSQPNQVHQGTISQPPSPPPNQGQLDRGVREGPQGGTQLRPSDADVEKPETPETAVAPGVGNITPRTVERSSGWPWLLVGLAVGFLLGIGFRRPAARTAVRQDIRKDIRDDTRHDRAA